MMYPWYDVPERPDEEQEEPRVCFTCSGCGEFIRVGEDYFEIEFNGEQLAFCDCCVRERTAEVEDCAE